jgi:hypothetical protein
MTQTKTYTKQVFLLLLVNLWVHKHRLSTSTLSLLYADLDSFVYILRTGVYPAGSSGSSSFSFLRNSIVSSIVATFLLTMYKCSSHQPSSAFVVYFLVDSQSHWGKMESQYSFSLHFLYR